MCLRCDTSLGLRSDTSCSFASVNFCLFYRWRCSRLVNNTNRLPSVFRPSWFAAVFLPAAAVSAAAVSAVGNAKVRKRRISSTSTPRTWRRSSESTMTVRGFDLAFLYLLFTAAFTEYVRVSAAAAQKNSRSVFRRITCCLLSIFVPSIRHKNELI